MLTLNANTGTRDSALVAQRTQSRRKQLYLGSFAALWVRRPLLSFADAAPPFCYARFIAASSQATGTSLLDTSAHSPLIAKHKTLEIPQVTCDRAMAWVAALRANGAASSGRPAGAEKKEDLASICSRPVSFQIKIRNI